MSEFEQQAFREFIDDLHSGRLSYEDARQRYRQLGEAIRRRYQQEITALCVDIVQSLQLKSTDELDGQLTFEAYHRWVERILAEHGCDRELTWAGDGVLAVFKQPEPAVAAAKALLERLTEFNARYNRLPRPVQVRVGVHTGPILTDETAGLGKIASRTFDIAGHLQEAAAPNQMYVSETTYQRLPAGQSQFVLVPQAETAGVVCFAYPAPAAWAGSASTYNADGAASPVEGTVARGGAALPVGSTSAGASIPRWAWALATVGLIAVCAGLTALVLAFSTPKPAGPSTAEIVQGVGIGTPDAMPAVPPGMTNQHQAVPGSRGQSASPSAGQPQPVPNLPGGNVAPGPSVQPGTPASGSAAWEPLTQPWRSPEASAAVPPQLVPSGPEHKWVLAIAVNSSGNPDAVSAAEAMALALQRSAGVPPDHVRLLTDAQATVDGLKQGFRWLQERASSGRDTVYVYLVGQSGAVSGEPVFFPSAPADRAAQAAISGTQVVQWLSATRAQTILLLTDTPYPIVLGAPQAADMGRRFGIVASMGKQSGEMAVAGMLAPVLLAGLQGNADADRDRRVSLVELLQYAEQELPRQSRGERVLVKQSGFGGGMPDLVFSALR